VRGRVGAFAADRRTELISVGLLILILLSLVAVLLPAQAGLAAAWGGFLRRLFGWAVYLLLVLALLTLVTRLLRRVGMAVPQLGLRRSLGAALLVIVLLALLHALAGATDLDSGLRAAEAGAGGGYAGALVVGGLVGAAGTAGAIVILAAVAVGGFALVLDASPTEALAEGTRRAKGLGESLSGAQRRSRRGSRRPESAVVVQPPDLGLLPVSAAHPAAPPVLSEAALDVPESEAFDTPPSVWQLPGVEAILDKGTAARADDEFDRQRSRVILDTLMAFGAPVRLVEINRGPAITQFGVEPDYVEGRGGRRLKVKVSKITSLADDLALALAAPSIRIQAPVPGKGYVGIEVPNTEIQVVALRDVMEAPSFLKVDSRLRLGLGQDVSGTAVAADLTGMPHLLIAGTTGSGKSVCVNAIISCLLLQNTPDELRFVMVDPKRVELAPYNRVPHLMAPVVVELERVVGALQWVSREMNDRYERFSKAGVRNIEEYNRQLEAAGQKRVPYLVLVIDELADLMMLAPDETERVITRLAQLARATGIHLIIATQRPSVDVVTGLIKANFPARIAFAVASSVDSRVILDQPGAERLLGRGDMLFQAPDTAAPVRMQGSYVSELELARLIQHWKDQAVAHGVVTPPLAPSAIPAGAPMKQGALWEDMEPEESDTDPLFDEAVEIVRRMRRASISLLQRRLRIGYTRSARLVDQLEARGIIGPAQSGSQAREVLDFGELAVEGD
jgi:S-DNA-T family DNA segregation ATPase FtsK/SpoIIIE